MEELLQKGVQGKERQRQKLHIMLWTQEVWTLQVWMSRTEEVLGQEEVLKSNEKKGLMSTWDDLDDTSSNEDEEEANLCLMGI